MMQLHHITTAVQKPYKAFSMPYIANAHSVQTAMSRMSHITYTSSHGQKWLKRALSGHCTLVLGKHQK